LWLNVVVKSLVIAALVSVLAIPLLRRFSPRGVRPSRLGGLALAAGLVAGSLAGDVAGLKPYWIGVLVVFAMGLTDDLIVLRPWTKLTAQAAAAILFLCFLGWSWWTPIFFLWLVGVTNSMNLLDNMDGLASGVGAVAALSFYVLAPAPPFIAIAGALLAFLVFNFYPARIYMGDGGSHLVGFTLAALPLLVKGLYLAPLILLVPIADTAFVAITRVARGVSPFKGGKDHLSHRLNRAGVPVPVIAVLFSALTAALGLVAWLAGPR
jgi:UDP-GlcNAc:undecaprenyl-phosphate GlcNAc-1-phosphate transferase